MFHSTRLTNFFHQCGLHSEHLEKNTADALETSSTEPLTDREITHKSKAAHFSGNLFCKWAYVGRRSPQEQQNDQLLQSRAALPGVGPKDLQALIKTGINVNRPNYLGTTALHSVCANRTITPELLYTMLDAGADPNQPDKRGKTPLHILCGNSYLTPARLTPLLNGMLAEGADLNAQDNRGQTPIHHLCFNSNAVSTELLQLCLEHGANLDQKDCGGQTPIDCLFPRKKHVASALKYPPSY